MKGEKYFNYVLLVLSALFLVGSLTLVPMQELSITSSAGYAIFIAILCLVFSAIIVFGGKKGVQESEADEKVLDSTIIAFMIMLVCYVIGIIFLHYTIATLLFIFAAVFYLKRDSWKQAILISYISTFMILLVFKYLFSVIMP